jgi:hypothetical protein
VNPVFRRLPEVLSRAKSMILSPSSFPLFLTDEEQFADLQI